MDAIRTTTDRIRPVRLLVACGTASVLAACTGGVDRTGSTTETEPRAHHAALTAPGDGGAALDPLGEPTTDKVEGGDFVDEAGIALLTDVRVAGQEGFDRVVLEFEQQVPRFRVEYVDPPITQDGSGRPVDIPGEAFLQITATPGSGVDLSGEQPIPTYDGPTRIAPPYGEVITEAVRTGDFESVLTWTVGLEERVPFGVVQFTDPPRLVVDIRHEGDGAPGDGDDGLEPVGPGSTDDVREEGTGRPVTVTDVRLGAHEGFDRVVFELAGDGEAGWEMGYVEDPTSQGSGEPVDVPGEAALGMSLTNIALPGDAPEGVQPWDGPDELSIRDAEVIEAVVVDSLFEGRYDFYAALDEQRPFAVTRFEDPQRIVVDVLAEAGGGEGVALTETCTSPAGFSVGYPGDWDVNAGETVPACSRFAPSDFDVPDSSDARVAATAFSIDAVAFDRVTEERPGEESRTELTVDGRDAVRIERVTENGLYPAGTPITAYVIELADGEDGPRTLIADTVGLDAFDYERNVEVLEAQVDSLDLDAEG